MTQCHAKGGPTMRQIIKKKWDNEAVSPVIATILMVAITVVLAGVLVLYMQNFSSGPSGKQTTALLNVQYKAWDQIADTSMTGYWTATVQTVDNPIPWSDVEVSVQDPNGLQITRFTTKDATQLATTVAITDVTYWVCKYTGGGTITFDSAPSQKSTPSPMVAPAATFKKGDFARMTNVTMVIVDNDNDKKMTAGDTIIVYRDYDNDQWLAGGPLDSRNEVPANSVLVLKSSAGTISQKDLVA
jgi:flagellin-like protein